MKNLMTIVMLFISMNAIGQLNLEDGVAIQGYDPVAYFKVSKPVEGKKLVEII